MESPAVDEAVKLAIDELISSATDLSSAIKTYLIDHVASIIAMTPEKSRRLIDQLTDLNTAIAILLGLSKSAKLDCTGLLHFIKHLRTVPMASLSTDPPRDSSGSIIIDSAVSTRYLDAVSALCEACDFDVSAVPEKSMSIVNQVALSSVGAFNTGKVSYVFM